MRREIWMLRFYSLAVAAFCCLSVGAADPAPNVETWPQWRGPTRDGLVGGPKWPDSFTPSRLKESWRAPLGPSYSGPVVSADAVFTTETRNREAEVVYALDRKTGKERWRAEWKGAMSVPF